MKLRSLIALHFVIFWYHCLALRFRCWKSGISRMSGHSSFVRHATRTHIERLEGFAEELTEARKNTEAGKLTLDEVQ